MNSAHVDNLIDGYVLRALAPSEHRAVADHIDTCDACRARAIETTAVVNTLPLQLDELSPRRALKMAILATARADTVPDRLADRPGSAEVLADRSASAEVLAARPASMLPFRMNRTSSNPILKWASLGVAAAFIIGIVGGLAGWAVVLGDRLDKKKDDLGKSNDTIETLVHSDNVIRMQGTFHGADIKAVLAMPSSGAGPLMLVSDLPPATAGDAYHLWLIGDGVSTSTSVSPNDQHDIVANLTGVDIGAYQRIELDLQPTAASAPGGETVIAGALR